jgi:hypothetical protein
LRNSSTVRPERTELEEEPLLALAALGAHQRPAAAELLALQLDVELAARHALARRRAVEGAVEAAVPQDHGAGAVVSRRDDAFEAAVLERMILGLHRQALLLRIHRRPARHRPADQDPVDLQTKIPVHAPRRVLLDDEGVARPGPRPSGGARHAERLGRARGVALGPVGIEGASAHRSIAV